MKINIIKLNHYYLDEVVKLHVESFPGYFITSLGYEFIKLFYKSHISNEYADALIALDEENKVVGSLLGVKNRAKFYNQLILSNGCMFLYYIIKNNILKPYTFIRLYNRYRKNEINNNFYSGVVLSSICIQQKMRKNGIATEIINKWIYNLKAQNYDMAYLETDATGNIAANNFYFKTGWDIYIKYSTYEGRVMNIYFRKI